jgi:hypothetical protein
MWATLLRAQRLYSKGDIVKTGVARAAIRLRGSCQDCRHAGVKARASGEGLYGLRPLAETRRRAPGQGPCLPSKLRRFGEADDRSVPRGTRFAAVSGEKVLKHRVQDVVLFAIEFRVFVKGQVARAADTLYRAQHVGSLAFQCLEFFAHILSGGREFYGVDRASQRYFRTPLWIFRGLRP